MATEQREHDDAPDFGGPTVGHCSKCGEARDSFYVCRGGGETIPKEAGLPPIEPPADDYDDRFDVWRAAFG